MTQVFKWIKKSWVKHLWWFKIEKKKISIVYIKINTAHYRLIVIIIVKPPSDTYITANGAGYVCFQKVTMSTLRALFKSTTYFPTVIPAQSNASNPNHRWRPAQVLPNSISGFVSVKRYPTHLTEVSNFYSEWKAQNVCEINFTVLMSVILAFNQRHLGLHNNSRSCAAGCLYLMFHLPLRSIKQTNLKMYITYLIPK